MGLKGKTNNIAAWIAIIAILVSAFAPSISQAFVSKQPAGTFSEICTITGMKILKTDAPVPGVPFKHLHSDHCPFCSLHGSATGMLPSASIAMPIAAAIRLRPILFYQAAHSLFAWSAAQPRAPPVFS